MPFINRLPVDDSDGRAVVSTDSPAGTDPYVAGWRYNDGTALGSLYVIEGAVPAGVPFQDGFARTDLGQVYVLVDDPPAAPDRVYSDGILGDGLGHICVTATNPIVSYMHGWPLDDIGQVCVTGTTPPPPEVTISSLLVNGQGPEGQVQVWLAQLYFGLTGASADTYYTSKATFLSDNPGLDLEQFTGIAPPAGTAPQSVFTGFTAAVSNGILPPTGVPTVYDSAAMVDTVFPFLPSIYCAIRSNNNGDGRTTITFSPPVSAAGLNLASTFAGTPYLIEFYDGVTLLHTEVVSSAPLVSDFDQFRGYATSATPTGNLRVTSAGDTRTTSGGDNRIWVP